MSAKDEAIDALNYLQALVADPRTSKGILQAQIDTVMIKIGAIVETKRPRRAKKLAILAGGE